MTDDPDKLDDFDIDDLGEEDEQGETVTVYELTVHVGTDCIKRLFAAAADDKAVFQASAWLKSLQAWDESRGGPRLLRYARVERVTLGELPAYHDRSARSSQTLVEIQWDRDGNRIEGGAACE